MDADAQLRTDSPQQSGARRQASFDKSATELDPFGSPGFGG
jgi:hypothetical protein